VRDLIFIRATRPLSFRCASGRQVAPQRRPILWMSATIVVTGCLRGKRTPSLDYGHDIKGRNERR